LYRAVDARGAVTLEALAAGWPGGRRALGSAKTRLEKLGLVLTREDHTASGAHETKLESWSAFANRCGADYSAVTPEQARETLTHYCRGRRHTLA
jgi:hypothetical protein